MERCLALAREAAANDEVSPVVSIRNAYFLVDPAAFSPDLAHAVVPTPSDHAFVGLLCDREVRDRCSISDQVGPGADTWVQWVQPATDDDVVGEENRERK